MQSETVSAQYVIDASAVLAYMRQEPGCEFVESILDEAVISAVNAAEVLCKLNDYGMGHEEADRALRALHLPIQAFDEESARQLSRMNVNLRKASIRHLSLGDRACLALAAAAKAPAVTCDRAWKSVPSAVVQVKLIR